METSIIKMKAKFFVLWRSRNRMKKKKLINKSNQRDDDEEIEKETRKKKKPKQWKRTTSDGCTENSDQFCVCDQNGDKIRKFIGFTLVFCKTRSFMRWQRSNKKANLPKFMQNLCGHSILMRELRLHWIKPQPQQRNVTSNSSRLSQLTTRFK